MGSGHLPKPETMPPSWTLRAACLNQSTDLWFSHEPEDQQAAKQVCRACEVKHECLSYSVEYEIEPGIWGGLNESERRQMWKRRVS